MHKAIRYMCFSLLLTFLFTGFTFAQELRSMESAAYLQINQEKDTSYVVFWKVPRIHQKTLGIRPVVSNFSMKLISTPRVDAGFEVFNYRLHGPLVLGGQTLVIEGLDKTVVKVLVNIWYSDGGKVSLLLQPSHRRAVLPIRKSV